MPPNIRSIRPTSTPEVPVYWCRECDHGFTDLTEYPADEPDEFYMGCPYCGSDRYRDLISEAEAYADGWENGR